MEYTVTVYYNGSGLIISKVIAERFNLTNNYIIQSENEFWEIINANASYNLLLVRPRLESKS